MFKPSTKQVQALRAICDAIAPSIEKEGPQHLYWRRAANALEVDKQILRLFEDLTQEEQKDLNTLLTLLASPALGLTWFGPLQPAHRLSLDQRTRLLQSWAKSWLPDLRKSFVTLKKLTLFFFFGSTPQNQSNPNWKDLGYEGSIDTAAHPDLSLNSQDACSKTDWHCDVVIVGSGAGGSVVAAELAAAGQEVIVLEKGPLVQPKEMNQREVDMMGRLYDSQAALSTVDVNLAVLAGSCVGGGTTINWAGAFRTPNYILEEWAKEHGNAHFLERAYQKGFDIIEKRTAVTEDLIRHNPQNQALWDGAKKLGYKVKVIPRNVRRPEGVGDAAFWKTQGYSPLGDRLGVKQSAPLTFLKDAAAKGAILLANTSVDKIVRKGAAATGVVATARNAKGEKQRIRVHARKVVVAAGSIHTPALLLRSGFDHPQIGRNLYFHPTTAVPGHYEQSMEPWNGPMMSAVVDEFTHLDGNYGFKLETPPVHPGLMAATINWPGGQGIKEDMLRVKKSGSFIVLGRDKYGGHIRVDKQGRPRIHYRLHDYDLQHLIRGMQEAVRIHLAAGAQEVDILHQGAKRYQDGKGDLKSFLQHIPQLNWGLNRYFLASAHQMSTCRMGGDHQKHPLRPDGQLRNAKNVFVADASAFPSASGANPMLSIQTLAYYIAQQIKISLEEGK